MTGFLASVATLDEAVTALTAGADIIDIKEPRNGALGAVEPALAKQIACVVNGKALTSATIGDLPPEANSIESAIIRMNATGVDIIKVGIFSDSIPPDVIFKLGSLAATGLKLVLVFFADFYSRTINFSELASIGIYGVMLDTADKTKGSLRKFMSDESLKCFINDAKRQGLLTGIAGSLGYPDIQPLLLLKPDYLGFRGALCSQQQRNLTIDGKAAIKIRTCITEHGNELHLNEENLKQAV